MKLTARLAWSQLKNNRRRALWTLGGIVLATAMLTAVVGFAASGMAGLAELLGDDLRSEYNAVISGLAMVMGSVVVVASVIVISNAFRVSAGERTALFGMLKSVGATRKQITAIVMYECLFLAAVGLPLGVLTGLGVHYAGIEIAAFFIDQVRTVYDHLPIFAFVFTWRALVIAFVVGFGTVLLSAYLPGRKAAKIPAIHAIRRTGNVQVRPGDVRTNRWVQALFGFEGTLAAKSLKRDRRNFRATIVSLSISIVLFVAAGSFAAHLNRLAEVAVNPMDADVIGTYSSRIFHTDNADGASSIFYHALTNAQATAVTAELATFPETTIMAVGTNNSAWASTSVHAPADMFTPRFLEYHLARQQSWDDRFVPPPPGEPISVSATLVTVDTQTYADLIQRAGVPHGSNLLMNYQRIRIEERWTELTPFHFAYQTLEFHNHGAVPLHGELRGADVPPEIMHAARGNLVIVIPELDAMHYAWYAQTADPSGFHTHMDDVFARMLSIGDVPWYQGGDIMLGTRNLAAEEASDRAVVQLVRVFAYGFVGMLTLIGLTNVISTLSANIRARAREFAVLQSVGMTSGGLYKMFNLESILCSLKSLAIGLPLGIVASFFIHRMVIRGVDFAHIFPWLPIAQSIAAVFLITWMVMRYTAAQLRKNNIIETINAQH
ncbi:MAG: ABC transporter permease [Defluviitaleaceae bacterium]|nr:ABC transporter permease [Defluviitaleaceae bacterium]